MTRPGTEITLIDTLPSRGAPTDTSQWFVIGVTEKGPDGALPVTSLADFVSKYGNWIATGHLYDAIDTYFHEGGTLVYVSREFGPSAVAATGSLMDASGSTSGDHSLEVAARDKGEWGNGLQVSVGSGNVSGFRIDISHTTDPIGETSPDLQTCADAIAWSANSKYIVLTAGVHSAEAPRTGQTTTLSNGTADVGNITDGQRYNALGRLTPDLGPGQVSAPGDSSSNIAYILQTHASANNRVALIDVVDIAYDDPTADQVDTYANTLMDNTAVFQTLGTAKYGAVFGPWVEVPGLSVGTKRVVPASAVVAGIIARNDGAGLSPDDPAAGVNGQSRYATGLRADFTADQRTDLNFASVNCLRDMLGGVRVYGWRSTVNPDALPGWLDFGNIRMIMAITAKASNIGEQYVLRKIDGKGLLIAEYGGALAGMLLPYWSQGALYGDTPEQAFNVNTGPSVNTPTTIANNELHAVISLRISPMAELVSLQIVKVGITEAVA